MKQLLVGAGGLLLGIWVAFWNLRTSAVVDVKELAAGRWHGSFVSVHGRIERVGDMLVLVSGDGHVALKMTAAGDTAAGTARGRLRKQAAGALPAGYSPLPYILDTTASRLNVAAGIGLFAALWGALLVWAGLRLRRTGDED